MVVESCVNTVGVNLNTASRHLLMYVSGLNATTAKNSIDENFIYNNISKFLSGSYEITNENQINSKAYKRACCA